jgi:hypothetical protein
MVAAADPRDADRAMHAQQLTSATVAVQTAGHSIETSTDVTRMAGSLTDLGEALRAAARACDQLAARVVPGDPSGPLCDRYRTAAEAWPSPAPPSHERLAAILASLHDTAAGARLAARRCDHAVGAVAATSEAGDAAA